MESISIFFITILIASIHLANAGGGSYQPSCNDARCKSPDFLQAKQDYLDEEAKLLSEIKVLAKQRPLTHKHSEAVTALIATYTDKLLPKFTKIKFAKDDCNGKLCHESEEATQENLKKWDCDLTDMLSEAIINKDVT